MQLGLLARGMLNFYLIFDEDQEGKKLKEMLALFQPLGVAPFWSVDYGIKRERWLQL